MNKELLQQAAGFADTFDDVHAFYKLEDFASLVADAERERITKLLDYLDMKAQPYHNYYKHASVEINRDQEDGKLI